MSIPDFLLLAKCIRSTQHMETVTDVTKTFGKHNMMLPDGNSALTDLARRDWPVRGQLSTGKAYADAHPRAGQPQQHRQGQGRGRKKVARLARHLDA